METKELKIQIPEGYEIDENKSTFEKIVFKKKDTKPRSWEEYCKQQIANDKIGYYIVDTNNKSASAAWKCCAAPHFWRNVLPSEGLTEAFLAMMQLVSLRQAWIGDWKPVWDGKTIIFCINNYNNKYSVDKYAQARRALSFPTEEMAKDFINCFKDLLEIAKPLI